MSNSAARIIEKCGGAQAVAEMLQVDISRVYRWTYPKDRGGSAGVIPSRHQEKLLVEASGRGIKLLPADFFAAAVETTAAARHDADPLAVAATFAQLGGHEVIAIGARIAVTDLEAMEAEGRIWSQHRRALVEFALANRLDLDADKLSLRPLGREHGRAA